jgi:ATP-dependent helicase HrpB
LAAAALSQAEAEAAAGSAIESIEETTFDPAAGALRARRTRRLGAIVIADQPLPIAAGPAAALVLAKGVAATGVDRLPWTKAQKQWRDRVLFLRRIEGEHWPDVSDAALAASAESWLAPFVEGCDSLATIAADDLERALQALLDWTLARRLEADAPTHFSTPAGSSVALDYEAEGAPVLAVRVQELYGLSDHPRVAGGRAPLTLHLLSPAHRPIQITRDLPGFWKGSWAAVRSEMRGRYPKHLWPDDPARAQATLRAKPRG